MLSTHKWERRKEEKRFKHAATKKHINIYYEGKNEYIFDSISIWYLCNGANE